MAILLALVGFFFMLKKDEEVIEAYRAQKAPTGWTVCGGIPWVTIDENGLFKHSDREWELKELVQHLVVDFQEYPFDALNVRAENSVSHETVVRLTDAIKQQLGITNRYRSCHTAVYKDFVFEGHIPAKFIQQFVANPPANAIGLAVPGMPLGSPGMEVEDRFNPYTIYQVNADGEPTVFAMIDNMADQY